MPDHMASESRDMLIGTKVAGPAKSHLYWSPSLLPSFRRLRSMFAPLGSERIFLDLDRYDFTWFDRYRTTVIQHPSGIKARLINFRLEFLPGFSLRRSGIASYRPNRRAPQNQMLGQVRVSFPCRIDHVRAVGAVALQGNDGEVACSTDANT